jgi:hypothetical protein
VGWAEDYLAKQKGIQQAAVASGNPQQTYAGGFVSSALSSIPELFGDKPSAEAEAFRAQNPVSGIISELAGGIVPYAAAGALSATATGARLLGGAMEALPGVRALTAVDNPILYSAAKEAVRYSPVEIARLGVGLGTTDNWHDYGNLFADVGLSTLITGGFGGIGGLFRVGGKSLENIGGVEGAPLGLRSTFEYRMSRTPDATPAVAGQKMPDVQNQLFKDVLSETPAESKAALPSNERAYVSGLEGGNPETDSLVNQLFKPAVGEKASVRKVPFMDKAGNWNIDEGQRTELLGALESKTGGQIKTMEDFAETAVFPRLVTVNSPRAAGTVSKALDDSAMQWVSDGVMAGKEADGGLHVVAVRVKAGGADAASTGENLAERTALAGETPELKAPLPTPPKIAQGDQWLIFKTDKPQLFAPEGYKLAQSTVKAWSAFRNSYRPSGLDDFANRDMDNNIQSFTIQDFSEATKARQKGPAAVQTAKARIASRLADRFAETAGLDNSATIKEGVDRFFDVFAPTVVNERRNPLFARLFGTLRSARDAGEAIVNKAVGGNVVVKGGIWTRKNLSHDEGIIPGEETIVKAVTRLTHDELQDLVRIGHAQAPIDEIEKYTANGLVSDNLRTAVDLMQRVDRHLWETQLMPAFKNAGVDGKFDLLEGYIMPRMFTGDWYAPVLDEHGNLAWLGNGTRRQAMAHAQTVVDEAAKLGRTLKIADPYQLGMGKPVDEIQNLHDLVQMQMGKDAVMQDAVQRAMRKIALDQRTVRGMGTLPSGPPKAMFEGRTGVAGSPDVKDYTHQDVIKSVDMHYKQLFRFAASSAWSRRFLAGEGPVLQKENKILYEDLLRKRNQMLGYEGKFTKSLNDAINQLPLVGHAMGGKAATKIATETNGLLYNWNLAILNPTFSVLNVLQPIQTVLPHLSFILSSLKHGLTEELEADMRMSLRYGGDGKPREVIGVLDPAKIMGRAFKLMGAPDEQLTEFLGRAKTEGHLMAQLYENFIGGQSRGLETIGDAFRNHGGGVAGSWEAMKRIATFTAERSEEVSRGIAFNSYYILGKDYLGLEGDKLYRFMVNGTRNSMFGYSLIDRSRMFTGPIGSMFGLFKNWQMHFISSMFQYANLGWQKGAWAPLLWQFGVAGSLGGLGAMGPLKWVADSLAKWNDNSPNSYLWMQENWHGAADEIYFGLPALFGASLQASSTLPGTDVRNDLTSLSSFVFLERAKAAGKATGAAWDYGVENGTDPLRNANIRDQLMQAYAPRAFFRAFASVEGDYIKSMSTGYPQVRDVSPLSKFLYGAGLNQVDVERQQVAARELWKDKTARRSTIQQLGKALADAQLNKDYDTMEVINQKAVAAGVPVTKVWASARTRVNREQNQDLMSQYKGDMVNRYKKSWGVE